MEQAALKALAHACNYSLHAHVPTEAVTTCVPKHLRGDLKKALKELHRKGYCMKHPTGGTTTWNLTEFGLEASKSY